MTGLVLGLVAANAVNAGPAAAAIPGLNRIATTVAGSSSAFVSATATCIQGHVVYGLGGEIIGGNGRVHLVSLLPNAALTSVTVIAVPRTPVTAGWRLTAYAICGRPTAEPNLVMTSSPSTAVIATCPAGRGAYGAGARHGGNPNWTLREMIPNTPAAAPTMVRVGVNPPAGMPGTLAAAICGIPLATLNSIVGPSVIGSTVTCPAGQRVHGTGGLSPTVSSDVVIEGIVPDPALTQVRVTARNGVTLAPQPTRAFAICA